MNLQAVGRLLCDCFLDYRNPLAAPAGGHAFVQEPSPRVLECPRRAYWSNGPEATTCKEGKGRENSAWRAWVSTARPCAYIYSVCPSMLHQDSEDGLVCKVHGAPHGSFTPKTATVDDKVHPLATVTTRFLFSVFPFGQQSARLTNGLRTMCVFTPN